MKYVQCKNLQWVSLEYPHYHWGMLGLLLHRHWECMLEQLLHSQRGIQLQWQKKNKKSVLNMMTHFRFFKKKLKFA